MRVKPQGENRIAGRAALPFLLCAIFLSSAVFVAGAPAAKKKPPARPIDINAATIKELEELPGVGPATAKAIIQFRSKSGPFKRPEDLLAIHGISPAKFEKMRPYVKVGAAAPRPGVPRTTKTTR